MEAKTFWKYVGVVLVPGLIVTWIGNATQPQVEGAAKSVMDWFTWKSLVAGAIAGGAAFVLSYWNARTQRLNAEKEGFAAGLEEGQKRSLPNNAYSKYSGIIDAIAANHGAINGFFDSLRIWKEKGRVRRGNETELNIAYPLIRHWNRIVEPKLSALFRRKAISDQDFRRLIHELNELSNMVSDWWLAYTFIDRNLAEPSEGASMGGLTALALMGFDLDHMISNWAHIISPISKSIEGWNKLNQEQPQLIWGHTTNERSVSDY